MDNLLMRLQAFNIDAEYDKFSEQRNCVITARQALAYMEDDLEVMAQTLFDNMIGKMAVSMNMPTHKVRLIALYRTFTEHSGNLGEDKKSVEDILEAYGINS